jgi:hypothetical protein
MYHWLLVEGINLYVMVGVVYNTARVKMWMYKILGWGTPALIVSLWAVFASYVMEDQVCKKKEEPCFASSVFTGLFLLFAEYAQSVCESGHARDSHSKLGLYIKI